MYMTVSYERIWRNSRIYWAWPKYLFTQLFSTYLASYSSSSFSFSFCVSSLCATLAICGFSKLRRYSASLCLTVFLTCFLCLHLVLYFWQLLLIKPFFEIQSFYLLKTPLYLLLLFINLFGK
jgi:hypothetical protein